MQRPDEKLVVGHQNAEVCSRLTQPRKTESILLPFIPLKAHRILLMSPDTQLLSQKMQEDVMKAPDKVTKHDSLQDFFLWKKIERTTVLHSRSFGKFNLALGHPHVAASL